MKQPEFTKRRKQMMRMVGTDGVAILPSAPVRKRSRDVEYRYRQDSDFYYLTGFAEPDAVAVLAPGRDNGDYILFCRERDDVGERWDGARAGTAGAVSEFGAADAFPIEDIDEILPGIIETRDRVYYTMGVYADFRREGHGLGESAAHARFTRGAHAARVRRAGAPAARHASI